MSKKQQIDYPVNLIPNEIEQLKQLLSKHSSPLLLQWIKDRIEFKEGLLKQKIR